MTAPPSAERPERAGRRARTARPRTELGQPSGRAAHVRTLRLAHRGDWRHGPENSLAAFGAALRAPRCDGLELDVRRSRDGVPVVIHDATLERVQGRARRASELTAEELEASGVPTLEAVLAAVAHRWFLDIELKEDLGRSVVEVIAAGRGPALSHAVVSSFDVPAIRHVLSLAPSWPCWLNATDLDEGTLARAERLGCRGVSVDWRAIDQAGMERAARHELQVAAWTVRRRPTFSRLERLGVVAVCVEGTPLDA